MRKIMVLCLVLSLACSSVFAFAGVSGLFKPQSEEFVVETAVEENSSKTSEKVSNPVAELLSEIEGNKTLNKKDVAVLNEKLADIEKSFEELVADMMAVHPYVYTGVQYGLSDGCLAFGPELGLGMKFPNGIMVNTSAGINLATIVGKEVKLIEGIDWKTITGHISIGYQF